MNRVYKTCVFLVIATLASFGVTMATAKEGFSPYVDTLGDISFPHGFRTSMVHLGSWFVSAGAASRFHDAYTEKATAEAFRRTGKFPDGATLVKELRASNASTYTTGQNVSYVTDGLKQWFVMIKDTKGRFSDNPFWGDGRFTNLMIEQRMWQPTTKPTAWVATYR
ncbi:MAG: hypothetical protein ACJAVI_003473 [Candidatus Azotimanducaceae bacterium]|jgi:hypothetical protein